MQFFILVLFICLFIFLYCVYVLANDDFIFLRRDVTMEKLFNIIFLGGMVSFFSARLFHGIFHSSAILSNPFYFLLVPYFPGLSLLGGIIGAGVFFLFLATRKKNPLPLGRMLDFFSIAFLISLPVGFIGYFMFAEEGISAIKAGAMALTYFLLFVIFLKFFLPRLLNGKFKEGTITFLFLGSFSIITLISNAFPQFNILDYVKRLENIMLVLILFISVGAIFKYESLLLKLKEIRGIK